MNAIPHLTNIPDWGTREFESVDAAIEAGKKTGFEFTVIHDGAVAASWTVFGGLRMHGLTHAEHAEKFPPRDGYQCTTDPKGDTYGGGCFNCGWKGARS